MKKIMMFILIILVLITGSSVQTSALTDAKSLAIQKLLDDACEVSGVPGISISMLSENKVFYFSSGYADREKGLPANEDTLYELASDSKAFTGMGILLLEQQGRLSMTDSVEKYLPWLKLKYKGKAVDMKRLSLNHFLHHTSGITNSRHTQNIPQGNTPDMLKKTVKTLEDTGLSFLPGERYEYGTVNYDVLGLVIESVSGQSYEDYMKEEVFKPLGLNQTFVYKEEAQASGTLAQGYRTSFFRTTPYDAPDYAGNKPAGYLISSARDMARWMGIQMGTVRDIPRRFRTVIKNSHQGDVSVPSVNGMYYAAGWMVNAGQTIIEHPGDNPNFSSEVVLLPKEKTAICLLTNSTNVNKDLVLKMKDILDGNLKQSYEISGNQLLDIVLSSATIIFSLLAIVLLFLGLRRWKARKPQPMTKKRIIASVILLLILAGLCILCCVLPWSTILVWQTYSIFTALISLILLTAGITWFVYTYRWYTLQNHIKKGGMK